MPGAVVVIAGGLRALRGRERVHVGSHLRQVASRSSDPALEGLHVQLEAGLLYGAPERAAQVAVPGGGGSRSR